MANQHELDDELVHMDELQRELDKHEINIEDFDQPIGVLEPPAPLIVHSGSLLKNAVKLMAEHNVGCVTVVQDRKLIGILTERHLLYRIADQCPDYEKDVVDDYMRKDPVCLKLTDPVREAVKIFREHEVRHIAIVNNNNEPIGHTSVKGMIDYIVGFFSEEVLNLPPHPIRIGDKHADGA
ncbi:CBS domain-containing protein [bacterium]|nr:MAG: CBS domain-containing protein [bacterium]